MEVVQAELLGSAMESELAELHALINAVHDEFPSLSFVFIGMPVIGHRLPHYKKDVSAFILDSFQRFSPFVSLVDVFHMPLADPRYEWSDSNHFGPSCFRPDPAGRPLLRNIVNMLANTLCPLRQQVFRFPSPFFLTFTRLSGLCLFHSNDSSDSIQMCAFWIRWNDRCLQRSGFLAPVSLSRDHIFRCREKGVAKYVLTLPTCT